MKRSKHSLSNYHILTGDMGEILPIGLVQVHPGDSFQHSTSLLLRVSPLNFPVMHPVKVKIEHYYVPDRILWDEQEEFITGGDDGTSAPAVPVVNAPGGGFVEGSLADYLGLPLGVNMNGANAVSAIPFRGYAKIWNDCKRNTKLQAPLVISTASGLDTTTSTVLKNANWNNDYFTAARPDPQLGPEVTIPLGTTAPIIYTSASGVASFVRDVAGNLPGVNEHLQGNSGQFQLTGGPTGVQMDNSAQLLADLSAVTGITIRQLRESSALQKYLEDMNIHGSRVSELLAQLGVRYSDARLQRPEYLGGGIHTIQFSEVLQTGLTTDGVPLDGVGALAGHGIATAKSNRYRKTFEEWGYVFTLMTVLPQTMYTQGTPRHWSRTTKTDYYTPQFARVGDQEILYKELYQAHATPNGVFGYGPRYEEYRRAISSVHGEFRSTMDFAHYGRIFGSDPALNSSFITADPTKRVNQVTSADVLWVFAHHSLQARRIVTADGEPGGVL